LTKHQFVAVVIRAVGYTVAGYISALTANQSTNALSVGVKAGIVIGAVTGIATACTSFIEWIADNVPEKRMGVFGVGLILTGFTLQSVQYWVALLDVNIRS
jgi:Na+/H+ antiporter NhaA